MFLFRCITTACVLIGALLFFKPAQANDYFVANSGSDQNSGRSRTEPWQTIQYAVNNPAVQPGDTINILAGRYTESVVIDGAAGGRCGAAGKYVTLQGDDPSSKPVFTGRDLLARLKIYNCSFYKVQNLHFRDFDGGGLLVVNQLDYTVMQNIEIRANIFEAQNAQELGPDWWTTLLINGGYGGLTNRRLENVLIEGNYFKDVRAGSPTVYNENIAIEGNAQRVLIQDNVIEQGHYIAVAVKGENGPACRTCAWDVWQAQFVTIRNNLIKDTVRPDTASGSVAIYIEGGRKVLIEGNTLQNNDVGISLGNEPYRVSSPPLSFDHFIVRNNSVVAGPQSDIAIKIGEGSCGWADQDIEKDYYITHNVFEAGWDVESESLAVVALSDSRNLFLKNNILFRRAGNVIYDASIYAVNRNWHSNGNLFYAPGSQVYFDWDEVNECGIVTYPSLYEYRTATGQESDSILARPRFVDPAEGDFVLTPSSPGHGQGIALTQTTRAGRGNRVPVQDAKYFYDGWEIPGETGDRIKIGTLEARIVAVDYATQTLTLDRVLRWDKAMPINYYFAEEQPDIGLLPSPAK